MTSKAEAKTELKEADEPSPLPMGISDEVSRVKD